MITPPYMNAYQTDRIRLPAKGTALPFGSMQDAVDYAYAVTDKSAASPFGSMQEAVVALVESLSPLLDPVNKASLVAWAVGQEGFTAPS